MTESGALASRGSLSIWFDPEAQLLVARTGNYGRQPMFADAALKACLTMKTLFGLALRQTIELVTSLLYLAGLDRPAQDFCNLCRCQKTQTVRIPY